MKLLQKSNSKNRKTERTGDLIGNKIPDKIKRVSKNPPKFSDTNEDEILRERYISPELRQKIIADLTLKEKNYWLYNRNVII